MTAFRRRSAGLTTSVVLLAAVIGACSQQTSPPSAIVTPTPGGTSTTSPDGAPLPPSDAAISDANSADAADTADAAPCLGDTFDGGTAPLARCPAGACKAACERVVPKYKGGVADAMVTCLAAATACDPARDVTACLDRALGRACNTAEASTTCSSVVTQCDPNAGGVGSAISQEGCSWIVRGMSSAGSAELVACIRAKIAAGTCPREVATCAEDVRR